MGGCGGLRRHLDDMSADSVGAVTSIFLKTLRFSCSNNSWVLDWVEVELSRTPYTVDRSGDAVQRACRAVLERPRDRSGHCEYPRVCARRRHRDERALDRRD